MANRTASGTLQTAPRGGRNAYPVANGVTLYAGSLVATRADGYLDKWQDTAGCKFEGVCLTETVGNTSATPPTEARVDTSGLILKNATVASLAQSNVNDLVYCSTDNPADLSLSASTNVKAVGRVIRFISSGVGDVMLFTPTEHTALN